MKGSIFFGAGGTRRRRVRIFARGFKFSREGFEYLREGDEGFEFFRGRETAPKSSNFIHLENHKKSGAKKTSFLYRLLCQKIKFLVAGAPEHFCWIFGRLGFA